MTLDQCLDAFVQEEILDKGNAWNCPGCRAPRKASKRLTIARLPPILLIHLKRFAFRGPFSERIDTAGGLLSFYVSNQYFTLLTTTLPYSPIPSIRP